MESAKNIAVHDVAIEADSRKKDRFWIWLKIESAEKMPSSIKIKGADERENPVTFENAKGKPLAQLRLGYHLLKSGVNELPPMPVTLRSPLHAISGLQVEIASVSDRNNITKCSPKVFFKPFLVKGGKI